MITAKELQKLVDNANQSRVDDAVAWAKGVISLVESGLIKAAERGSNVYTINDPLLSKHDDYVFFKVDALSGLLGSEFEVRVSMYGGYIDISWSKPVQ